MSHEIENEIENERAQVFEIKLNALNYVHFMQAKWPCDKFPALMFATAYAPHAIAQCTRCCWLVWSLASRVPLFLRRDTGKCCGNNTANGKKP